MQDKGDRYYLDGEVKFSLNLINILKKMNTSYPKNSPDFDVEFVRHLLKGILSQEQLSDCSKASSLRCLDRPKLKLAKGNL